MVDMVLPELGEGISSATLAGWHTRPGQPVAADEDIVELVTDKATFFVPSPASGILKEILVPEGQDAFVGQVLARIEQHD